MNLKNLRIGNLILAKWEDEEDNANQTVTSITGLSEDEALGEGWSIMLDNANGHFEECETHPIRLTAPVIRKIKNVVEVNGKRGRYWYVNPFSNLRFYIHNNTLQIVKDENNVITWIASALHLHTFQNIFYFLTEYELEINKEDLQWIIK